MSSPVVLNARPVTRASLADSVYQSILEAILGGAVEPGSELSEVALAAELHVSRTPVHDALKRLAADGMVERLENRRARVTVFSREQVIEIYDIRMLLEPAAAERAAARLDARQLAELRRSAESLINSIESDDWSSKAIEFDVHFHDVLAYASGNSRLHAEIIRYRRLVRALCRMAGQPCNLRQALDEHRQIISALEARDPTAARRSMAAHIEQRLQAVLRAL
ncbi:MAG: GntR family transcriptional regulator [Planctomycetaceae bacterium]